MSTNPVLSTTVDLARSTSIDAEFRRAVAAEESDGNLVIHCFRYLRAVCAEYGTEGRMADSLINIVEEVIK